MVQNITVSPNNCHIYKRVLFQHSFIPDHSTIPRVFLVPYDNSAITEPLGAEELDSETGYYTVVQSCEQKQPKHG